VAPSGTNLIRVRLQGFELDDTRFTDVAIDALDLRATNLPPTVATNTGSTVDEGSNDTITQSELETTDPEQGAADLTYTIDTDVTEGNLFNTNTSTQLDQTDTFTQADLNNGAIEYRHDGTEPETGVSFDFTVRDGQGGSTSGSFGFTINPVNDAPTVSLSSNSGSIAENNSPPNVVASITVNDPDGGTNNLSLSGADAGDFNINGSSELEFTTTADFESKSSYDVTVEVNDPNVGSDPDDSKGFALSITDVPDLQLTDGSSGGLDFTAKAQAGTDDNAVGLFRLVAEEAGATFTELTVTNGTPGVSGITTARLYWSTDQALDPGSDNVLATFDVDDNSAESTFPFDGFSQSVPTADGYVVLALDVAAGAPASDVQFTLEQPSDLTVSGSELKTVNGTTTSSFSSLPLSNGAATLPVELASFAAQTRNGERVRLQWQTASETNNAGFEVQRLVKPSWQDGSTSPSEITDGWQTVGAVDGAGTTTEVQSYAFTDASVPYDADSLTYRLKQVDTNGTVSYSEARTVARSTVEAVRLLGTFPNPARGRATVRFAVPDGSAAPDVTLRLYDVLGRQVRTVRAGAEAGRHELQLDTSRLPSGMYFLRLQVGGTTRTQQVTVVQ